MMRHLHRASEWCYRFSKAPALIAVILLFLLFVGLVLPNVAGRLAYPTGAEGSPDTSFLYSADDLYAMAESYGPEGRASYIYSRFTFDLIWPLVYLLFLVVSISYLFRSLPPASPMRLLNLLPLGGMLFDLLENSAASVVMYRYPLPTPLVAELAPVFTFLKWLFIGASFVVLAAGLLVFVLRRLRDRT
jgi:hypothetical protein